MPYLTNKRPLLSPFLACLAVSVSILVGGNLSAVDVDLQTEAPTLDRLYRLYNSGQYEEAANYARAGQEIDPWVVDWEVFEARSLLALGRYEEAYQSLEKHLEARSYDIRSRLLLREASLFTGRENEADLQLEAISFLINERSRRYSYDPQNVVAIGESALLFGVEPKVVLENFFRRVQQRPSPPVSAFLAAGNLALEKQDFRLASKTFQQGIELFPDDAELWHGLAASFREGDRSKLIEYANRVLQINPNHVPTHVLIAEHLLAAEAYDEASHTLDNALVVNPLDPEALALKAVLAFLRNETETGEELRSLALSTWRSNPMVDHTIGRELSKKYRFEDGASSQRIALLLDESFNRARIQLAQDLLRLGRNDEAWRHANAVYQDDPYNIAAYNLVTLQDKLQDFETLESDHFLIRLSKEEAPVYGQRALRILEDAHANLTERYGIELPQKTTVEIYPNPADFETRTFGVPGNPGFLGVCFGPVFTINSPATRSNNWEAVLYHEFTHTITLTMTNNRMPRWLSEGISVFEEQAIEPSWGQRMSAGYRDRILSGNMQPISNMSAAFLQAQSGEDVQFAYYQSYLVVEFLVQKYGLDGLKSLLQALGEGMTVNDALAANLDPLDELDAAFVDFAKTEAAKVASDFKFASSSNPLGTAIDLLNPKANYTEELQRANELIEEENWSAAIDRLTELIDQAGYLPGEQNAHWPLSIAYRESGDKDKEREILETITKHEAHSLRPITRLLEIAREQEKTVDVLRWSDAWLAINPMAETPWRSLLNSASSLQRTSIAVEAASALIALEPPDIASLHFKIAKLYQDSEPSIAKRHVLQALENAPRFQDAYQLLASLPDLPQPAAKKSVPTKPDVDLLDALDLNNDFPE